MDRHVVARKELQMHTSILSWCYVQEENFGPPGKNIHSFRNGNPKSAIWEKISPGNECSLKGIHNEKFSIFCKVLAGE